MRDWGKCFNVYERQRANIANIKSISKIKKRHITIERWSKYMDAKSKQSIDNSILNLVEEKEFE